VLAWNGNLQDRFDEIAAKAKAQPTHHTRRFGGKNGDVLRMFTSGGAAVAVGDYDNDGFDDMSSPTRITGARATSITTTAT